MHRTIHINTITIVIELKKSFNNNISHVIITILIQLHIHLRLSNNTSVTALHQPLRE